MQEQSSEQNALYINSFTMRRSGDDTSFVVDLGVPTRISSMQLNQFTCDNLFLNFYRSQGVDFTQGMLQILYGGVVRTVSFTVDQYLPDLNGLSEFVTEKIQATAGLETLIASVTAMAGYRRSLLQMVVRDNLNVSQSFALLDSGFWRKLGYGDEFSYGVFANNHQGITTYDLSQTPMVLIQINEAQPLLTSIYGKAAFAVQNTSNFGSKIHYLNTQQHSAQRIYFNSPIVASQLTITLLNCDQQPLTTPRGNGSAINQNGLECTLVLSINL